MVHESLESLLPPSGISFLLLSCLYILSDTTSHNHHIEPIIFIWYSLLFDYNLILLTNYKLVFSYYTVDILPLAIEIAIVCNHVCIAQILIRLASYIIHILDPYPIIIRISAYFSHTTCTAIIIKWLCGHDTLTYLHHCNCSSIMQSQKNILFIYNNI